MVYQRKKRTHEPEPQQFPQVQPSLFASPDLETEEADNPDAIAGPTAAPSWDTLQRQIDNPAFDFGKISILPPDSAIQRQPVDPSTLSKREKFSQRFLSVQREPMVSSMSGPPGPLDHHFAAPQREDGQAAPLAHTIAIQRQAKTADQETGAIAQSGAVNLMPKGSGRPLPKQVTDNFVQSGYPEVKQARVHVDDAATQSIQAKAYTQNNNIVVQSSGANDSKLLGHEATHVVQQSQMALKPDVNGTPINANPTLEKNADDNGERVARNESVNVKGASAKQPRKFAERANIAQRNQLIQRIKWKLPSAQWRKVTLGDKTGKIIKAQGKKYIVQWDGINKPDEVEADELSWAKEENNKKQNKQVNKEENNKKQNKQINKEENNKKQNKQINEEKDEKQNEQALNPLQDIRKIVENIEEIIKNDEWDNPKLVKSIGERPWEDINQAWKIILKDNSLKDKRKKFVLVRLRGKKYKGIEKDDITSYKDWPETYMGTQKEHKWGTETEGGGVTVSLKEEYQYNKNDKTSTQKTKKLTYLKRKLTDIKRSDLITTDTHGLSIDNVNDKLNDLLKGRKVELPLEIASKPMTGNIGDVPKQKNKLISKEKRNKETWPTLMIDDEVLKAKKGTKKKALDEFNKHFISDKVWNVKMNQNIQHVTKSGELADRLKMAKALQMTANYVQKGTRWKSALSGKPKTSFEFLRSSVLTDEDQIKSLEQAAANTRKILSTKLDNLKFADEKLNGIILPITGVPREVGGYTLTTPMTNSFPLLKQDKRGTKVTVLREYR